MQTFFDDVQEIKKTMSTIRYNIRQIEQNHGECLTATSAEKGREATDRLEELMKGTNGAASQARAAIGRRHCTPPTPFTQPHHRTTVSPPSKHAHEMMESARTTATPSPASRPPTG